MIHIRTYLRGVLERRGIYELADVLALPRLWTLGIRRRLARLILRSPLGRDIEVELALAELHRRAEASGAEVYCVTHDCDAKNCPKECWE